MADPVPAKIISGGQTGPDRAALDAARDARVPYGGWCPKGGRAEDHPDPPGLLADYPKLTETGSAESSERTERNVRDSDGTLVIRRPGTASPGTDLTEEFARRYGRPCLTIDPDDPAGLRKARSFVETLGGGSTLNVAGPRESESPGIQAAARFLLDRLLAAHPAP